MKTIKMVCPNLEHGGRLLANSKTNEVCQNHVESITDEPKWYNLFGFYYSKRLKRRIQRFICHNCGKTFSTQTFSVDYWVKITVDYKEIEEYSQKIDTIRDMGRRLDLSDCVITNRLERLSRQFTAIDWKYERLCDVKTFGIEVEGLYGVKTEAERYIVNIFGKKYTSTEQQRMLKTRFFISHMDLEGPMRLIWLQRYKPGTVFIPQFIAG